MVKNKKIRKLFLLLIFLLPVVLPFIEVESAVTHAVEITNPMPGESFSYYTTDEVFTSYSITGGLTPEVLHYYYIWWYIDTVQIDDISGGETSSVGGSLILTDEFDTTVDVSAYSVGEHDVKARVKIYQGVTEKADDDHTHTWSRDPPNDPPTISISAPTAYQQYNRSSDTSISTTATITDPETSLDFVQLFWDNTLNRTWTSPANGEKTHSIAIDGSTATGNHIISWFANDSHANEVWENITVVIYAGNNQIIILDPGAYYLNGMDSVTFYTADADGLNNLSFKVRQDLGQFNISDSIVAQICNTSYDKLLEVAGYYETSVCYVEYTKIQKWVEDSQIDDSGGPYFEWMVNNHDDGTQNGGLLDFSDSSDDWTETAGGEIWKRDGGVFFMNDSVAGSYGAVYMLPEDEITLTDFLAWSVKVKFRMVSADMQAISLVVTGNLNDTNDYHFKANVIDYGQIQAGISTSPNAELEMVAGYWKVNGFYTIGDWISIEILFDIENSTVKYYFNDVLKLDSPDYFSQIYNASYTKKTYLWMNSEAGVVADLEVDDFTLNIYSFDWFTSSEGWDWVENGNVKGDRMGGSMIIYDSTAGSAGAVLGDDHELYAYPYTDSEFYWESALTPNETAVKYDFFGMVGRFGSKYFTISLFGNDTLCVGVTNSIYPSEWFSVTQTSVTFTQNQEYIFRLMVGVSWVAYQYSTGSGFTTVRNSTSDYSSHYGLPVYCAIVVDNAGGQVNGFLFMDYFKSGWADWQTGTYAEVGLSETTTVVDDQSYYLNITSTQACRIWTTIQTESNKIFVNISDTYIFSVYTGSAGTEDTTVYSNFTNLFSELSEGIFYINISLNNDLNYNFSLIQSFYKDITAPNIEIIKPLSYTIRIYEVGEPIELLYNATYQDFELIVYEYIYLNGYYQSILSNGDVFYRATGLHELVVFVIDEAGNSNSTSVVFEVIEFSQCQITYLDTFQNPLNFERFNTYVTTSRFSRYNELDSYISLEDDDTVTIETYNRDGYQLSSATYNYAERLYIDLSVHFIQWQNTNISTTVQVFISWSFDYYGAYQNSLNFTLAEGMISEEVMIYSQAYYFIQYNDSSGNYKKHNIGPILGSELVNYKVGINMTPKTSLWVTFQNILSIFSMIISPIFALMAVNRYRNQDKKNFWIWAVMAILFGVVVLGMNETVTMQTTTWMYLGIIAIGFLAYVVYKKRFENKTDFGET